MLPIDLVSPASRSASVHVSDVYWEPEDAPGEHEQNPGRFTRYAIHTVLRLQNSRMPSMDSSRPKPDRLIPPNGSSG